MQTSEHKCNINEYWADYRIATLQIAFTVPGISQNRTTAIAKAFYNEPLVTHDMDKINLAIEIIKKGAKKTSERWARRFMAKCTEAKTNFKCNCPSSAQELTEQYTVLEQHCEDAERRNEALEEALRNERREYQSDQQKFKRECQAYKDQVTELRLSTRMKEAKLNELNEKLSLVKDLTNCQICQKKITKPISAECGHVFCHHCLKRNRTSRGSFTCPICKRTTRPRRQRQVFMLTDLVDHLHEEEPEPTDFIVIDSDSD